MRSAPKAYENLRTAGMDLKFSIVAINTYFKPFYANSFKGAASDPVLLFVFSRSGIVKQSDKHGHILLVVKVWRTCWRKKQKKS